MCVYPSARRWRLSAQVLNQCVLQIPSPSPQPKQMDSGVVFNGEDCSVNSVQSQICLTSSDIVKINQRLVEGPTHYNLRRNENETDVVDGGMFW